MDRHQVRLLRLLSPFGLLLAAVAVQPPLTSAFPLLAAGNCVIARTPASSDAEEQSMLVLINDYRARNGLSPLARSPGLTRAALFHSADMATNHYFSHDDLARGFGQRMTDCGYGSSADGENIAEGNADAAGTFEQWRTSAGHNANLLGGGYRAVGVGRAQSAGGTWYWTADFGPMIDADATSTNAASPPTPPPAAPSAILPTPSGSAPWLLTPLPATSATSRGTIATGTTVLVNTPGDCLNAHSTPSLSAPVSACIADGTSLFLVQGPVTADGHTWWAAFGAGWVAGDYLRPGP